MNLRNRFGVKASAAVIAVGGLGLGLIGSGVHAAFTDGGSATESVSVGTMGITVSTDTVTGVVIADSKHFAYTAPMITSSAAGSAPVNIIVKNTGSIAATVTITPADSFSSAAVFSDKVPALGVSFSLAAGETVSTPAGIQWTELGTADEGKSESVVYSISATA